MPIGAMVQNSNSTSGQLVSAVQHLEVGSSEECLLAYLVVDAGCQRGLSSSPFGPIHSVSPCGLVWAASKHGGRVSKISVLRSRKGDRQTDRQTSKRSCALLRA